MASLTISPRPFVSSPLAGASPHAGAASRRITPRRNPSFPPSQALRPFPSVSTAIRPATSLAPSKKPVKLIQPPQNQSGVFVLNLTQAELSRQD